MMAAFIVAIRGTVAQAALLGLSAALSHSMVVWAVALLGLYFGQQWGGEASEGYFQIGSAVFILAIAAWMAWRIWQDQNSDHDHSHNEMHEITTRAGSLTLEVFEDGVPPCWRVRSKGANLPAAPAVSVMTLRPDGTRQVFAMAAKGEYLESIDEIPEPHAFKAQLILPGEFHEVVFEEHDHAHMNLGEEDDAHARAHAYDIRRRFEGRTVTTWQIIVFGLTGGLIPCPAAITVLLLCIQIKQFSLGFVLVVCFGIGLALTMVTAGVVAALSMKHIASRWSGFSAFAHRAPYLSVLLITLVGFYTGWIGWHGIVS
jgi:nickel/cobalt exporter